MDRELRDVWGDPSEDPPRPVMKSQPQPPPSGTLRYDADGEFYLDTLFKRQWRADLQKATPASSWDAEIFSDGPRITPAPLQKRAPSDKPVLVGEWWTTYYPDGSINKTWHRSLGPTPAAFIVPRIPLVNHE
jgi:hypothetical protein